MRQSQYLDDYLDGRGFLFDQLDCPQYFTALVSTDLSCELLTSKACTDLYQTASKENPHLHITYMSVTLSPEPFEVSITKCFIEETYVRTAEA